MLCDVGPHAYRGLFVEKLGNVSSQREGVNHAAWFLASTRPTSPRAWVILALSL